MGSDCAVCTPFKGLTTEPAWQISRFLYEEEKALKTCLKNDCKSSHIAKDAFRPKKG